MISIIVATDDDLLIGKKDSSNGMPWHNKEDLQHFKKTTLHQTILMGKTTYMAIGRPLPHRKTIVVTRGELDDERVEVKHDLVETIQEYKNKTPIIPYEERKRIVEAIRYVDKVVPQVNMNKREAWEREKFNALFHGDDWKGSSLYGKYEKEFEGIGVEIVFLPHTSGTSSTMLTSLLEREINGEKKSVIFSK